MKKARNLAFDDRTPIEIMRENRFAGLLMVRAYPDRVLGEQNESESV